MDFYSCTHLVTQHLPRSWTRGPRATGPPVRSKGQKTSKKKKGRCTRCRLGAPDRRPTPQKPLPRLVYPLPSSPTAAAAAAMCQASLTAIDWHAPVQDCRTTTLRTRVCGMHEARLCGYSVLHCLTHINKTSMLVMPTPPNQRNEQSSLHQWHSCNTSPNAIATCTQRKTIKKERSL